MSIDRIDLPRIQAVRHAIERSATFSPPSFEYIINFIKCWCIIFFFFFFPYTCLHFLYCICITNFKQMSSSFPHLRDQMKRGAICITNFKHVIDRLGSTKAKIICNFVLSHHSKQSLYELNPCPYHPFYKKSILFQ